MAFSSPDLNKCNQYIYFFTNFKSGLEKFPQKKPKPKFELKNIFFNNLVFNYFVTVSLFIGKLNKSASVNQPVVVIVVVALAASSDQTTEFVVFKAWPPV